MDRMGVQSILSIKASVTVDRMLNFNGDYCGTLRVNRPNVFHESRVLEISKAKKLYIVPNKKDITFYPWILKVRTKPFSENESLCDQSIA